MKIIRQKKDINKLINKINSFSFIPTMGGLHKGHEYLIEIGKFYEGPLDDDDKALEYYEQYLSLYPQDVKIHLLIGGIQMDQDAHEKAKESFERVLIIEPNNIDAFISIIEIDYESMEKIGEMGRLRKLIGMK